MLVERAPYAGAKNMYGGVIYSHAASEIFPNYKEAPIERYISKHNYVLLSDEDSTEISYKTRLTKSALLLQSVQNGTNGVYKRLLKRAFILHPTPL